MQIQIYVYWERSWPKGGQRVGFQLVVDSWRRVTVRGPGPGYLRVDYTSFSSWSLEQKSVCLTTPAWNETQSPWGIMWAWPWSKPLTPQDAELIPLTTWWQKSHQSLRTLRLTRRSSRSAVCSKNCLHGVRACGPVPRNQNLCGPRIKGAERCGLGSSISIPRRWENAK